MKIQEAGENCLMRSSMPRSLHHTLLGSHQINEHEMGGACSEHGEMRNTYKILVGSTERNSPLV
jgi:hypothetical protein